MYKFDITYTVDDYYDYYKNGFVIPKFKKDLIMSMFFFLLAIIWWVSPSTSGNTLPILSIAMGIILPFINFLSLISLRKKLQSKAEFMANTHILVTFDEDKVVYENLSTNRVDKVADDSQRVFDLKYESFGLINEIKESFLFYLDRQTIIIVPKRTMIEGNSIEEFKEYLSSKIINKRVIHLKK